jgi:ABC-type uncharacterized transport system permease subunit
MIEHLRLISKATEKDRYAVVIMDRAAWHTILLPLIGRNNPLTFLTAAFL